MRDLILDSAVAQMDERGFHGTSMRDIATGADITVASIYNHFASKQEILQDIMVRVLQDAISLTRTAVIRSGARPGDQLDALVREWTIFHARRRAEAHVGASEIRSLDTAGHRVVVALRDEQENLFRDVVEHGLAQGDFHTPYPHDAVRALISMGYTISSWYHTGGTLSPEQLSGRYVVLARGIVEARGQSAS